MMAAQAAALTAAGTSKSGWPMLRLIGSRMVRASSKTLRMPEDPMAARRRATQRLALADVLMLPRAAVAGDQGILSPPPPVGPGRCAETDHAAGRDSTPGLVEQASRRDP